VRFRAFAVRPWRTAKPLFPVVTAAGSCRKASIRFLLSCFEGTRPYVHDSLVLVPVSKERTYLSVQKSLNFLSPPPHMIS
jgi:hypothetical protein